jgi:hypothetical protein
LDRTSAFLAKDEIGTSMRDIYACINWILAQGKRVAGGRNFSVVWDKWGNRDGARELVTDLSANRDMFKLRRRET